MITATGDRHLRSSSKFNAHKTIVGRAMPPEEGVFSKKLRIAADDIR
jgi:hypothetical protein